MSEQNFSGFGQKNALADSIKQTDARNLFQLFDLQGNSGLRQVQLLGRASKR